MDKTGDINDFESKNKKKGQKIVFSLIPEFSSGFSTQAVVQETTKRPTCQPLKPMNNGTPYKGTMGRGPAVKAAVRGLSYRNTTAFTLIEILVVVLIIGILAAIALPQYQRAVVKSRAMAAVAQGKALMEAQKLYYMENGRWGTDLEKFTINAPEWTCYKTSSFCARRGLIGGATFEITRYNASKIHLFCAAGLASERANQLCSSLGGTLHHVHRSTNYYAIVEEKLY